MKALRYVVLFMLLCSLALGAKYTKKQLRFVDMFGDEYTSLTSVTIQDAGTTTTSTLYSDPIGTSLTNPITSGLGDGIIEFWSKDADYKVVATDGTDTLTVDNMTGSKTYVYFWGEYLGSLTSYNLGQTDDLDFTYGAWVIDGDTAGRLDMIPDADASVMAIGDGDYQADVYIYSDSTNDYWLFDEGAGEVYYENLDLQFGDNDILYLGADNDASITYDETTDDNLEIAADSVGMSISTNDFLATLDGAAADQFKVDATGTIDGDAINLETTNGGVMVNADGASYGDIELNAADDIAVTSAGDTVVDATGGSIKLDCGEASAADGINIVTTGAGSGIDITSLADIDITTTGAAGEDITITNTGGSIAVSATENIQNSIHVEANGGASESINLYANQGTGASASTEHDASIQLQSDAGGIGLYTTGNVANAIRIEANGGASETINVSSVKGTGAASIDIDSTVGGVTIATNAASKDVQIDAVLGSIELEAEEDAADAIKIIADGDTSSGIILLNDTGTGDESIYLDSDAGGITLNANAGSIDIEAVGASDGDIGINAGDDMTLTAAGDLTLAITGTWSAGGSALTNFDLTTTVETGTTDTIAATESGSIIIYTMTGGACTATLPDAADGLWFILVDGNPVAANDLTVDPQSGDTINGDSAGEYIKCENDRDGEAIIIFATSGTAWYTIACGSSTVWTEE